jgi:tetratricopeptide (TPR) repeat protein
LKSNTPKGNPSPLAKLIADAVPKLLQQGKFREAVQLAQERFQSQPTPEHEAQLRDALIQGATLFAEQRNSNEFSRMMTAAERLPPSPDWTLQLAILHASGWSFKRAQELIAQSPIPTAATQILGAAADRAVRCQERTAVPEEHRPAFDHVTRAFTLYELSNNANARELLAPIGMQSPFAEWKLLLRGLLALSEGDSARALENWQRLNPQRLPFRVAAPLRASLDAAFLQAQPEAARIAIERQMRALVGQSFLANLKALMGEVQKKDRLEPLIKSLEANIAQIKSTAPHLIPRLSNFLYQMILTQGEPKDLPRHRKLFGPHPDDPEFNRLVAQVQEQIHEYEVAIEHWQKYERWLAGSKCPWPEALRARARAIVHLRIGNLAQKALQDPLDDEDFSPILFIEEIFGKQKSKKDAKLLDPIKAFQQAATLAPDWAKPTLALVNLHVEQFQLREAEQLLRKQLEQNPNSPDILTQLGDVLQKAGNEAQAWEIRQRELALNPFSREVRKRASLACLSFARALGQKRQISAAYQLLDEQAEICRAEHRAMELGLRITLAEKAGDAALLEKSLAESQSQAIAPTLLKFHRMVNAILLKLKPAQKKALAEAYLTELTHPLRVEVWQALWEGQIGYSEAGASYTGEKTHRSKLLAAAISTAKDPNGSESEAERLAKILSEYRERTTLLKCLTALTLRFPNNPIFWILSAEIELQKNPRSRFGPKIYHLVMKAKLAMKQTTQVDHQDWKPRLQTLIDETHHPNWDFSF